MDQIQLLKAPPIYRQIVAKFEEQIYSGTLKSGDRIAPTLELAKDFGVGRNAVQQALSILAERGLIERRSKRGTFVCEQINSRTIGVIFGHNIVTEQYSQFNRLLYGEIVRQAQLNGWRTALYFPVTADNHAQQLSQLGRDIAAGKLRAIIDLDGSTAMNDYLSKSSCVSIEFDGSTDDEDIPETSLLYRGASYLLDMGYRNIGVINMSADDKSPGYTKKAYNSKNIDYSATIYNGKESTEQQGIELTEAILSEQSPRPDALLVLNDTVCKGVIFALMNYGLKIPQEMALLAQTNKGHELLCPVPLTRLELDPEAIVKANMKQLFAKISGEKLSPCLASPQLIIGRSCGEK